MSASRLIGAAPTLLALAAALTLAAHIALHRIRNRR